MAIEQRIICDYCNDEISSRVDRYGELEQLDGYEIDGEHLCDNCFSDNFTYCNGCGDAVSNDDVQYHEGNDEYYCESCYPYFNFRTLNDYHESPELVPLGGDWHSRLYGVELEVDDGDNKNDVIENIIDLAGEIVFFQRDGSLSCNGMELITFPATLSYHMNKLPWIDICDELLNYNFRSHDTSTCGLHVHINRKVFGDDGFESDLNIAKLMILFERHWDELVIFSRRNYRALEQWAKKPDLKASSDDSVDDIINKSKFDYYNRYRAINIKNHDTVEIRIFKGTLKASTILASIQLLDVMLDYILCNDIEKIFNCTFYDVLKGNKYIDLENYLYERGL